MYILYDMKYIGDSWTSVSRGTSVNTHILNIIKCVVYYDVIHSLYRYNTVILSADARSANYVIV
jgi:hypothetical protein